MGIVFGVMSEERPNHEVLKKCEAYEIRRYPPCLVATTTGTGTMHEGKDAFPKLASYIGVFGTPKNVSQKKMAMTAPVVMTETPPGGEKV